jgi:sugar lactone lactonase YvrE
MVASEPASVLSLGATLGEGPVWVERDKALWFVDIRKKQIHRFDPATEEHRSFEAPELIGFALPAAGGGFVAGLQSGLAHFDDRTGEFQRIAEVQPDLPQNRLNDGTVDPSGCLWFGTMDNEEKAETGAIHRLGDDGSVIRSGGECCITNGPAVSPDGRTLYHVDTLGGRVYACTISDDGSLTDRRLFCEIPNSEGYPDGPTVDSEGCVWIGLFFGWSARRYSPEGELIATVRFPVSNITKIAFGGPHLRTAFATTARQGLKPDQLAEQPLAGNVFAFEVETPGLPAAEVSHGVIR